MKGSVANSYVLSTGLNLFELAYTVYKSYSGRGNVSIRLHENSI